MYCVEIFNRDTNAQVFRHTFPQGTEDYSSQITLSAGTNYDISFFGYGASSGTASITNIQLEAGSTPTSYAPYSNICPISGHTDADVIVSPTLNQSDGTTYPIPLGTTVFGCTVDPLLGKAVVDRAIVDLGEILWGYTTSGQGRFMTSAIENTAKAPSGNGYKANILCDTYKAITANDVYNGLVGVALNTTPQIWFRDGIHTNADLNDGVASWLNGVQLVYELAEPFEISLTPEEITLLQGENNLFSDGEMTLVYLADGNASEVEALNILLGGRYVNNHGEDEPTDREALQILLGGNR
jgi:hypothetical protein